MEGICPENFAVRVSVGAERSGAALKICIIGVDYHPSDQYIACSETETAECGERRLNHSDGEAEKFYRELAARGISVRVGMEATGYSRWFELYWQSWVSRYARVMRPRSKPSESANRRPTATMLNFY
jgi:hypothetical protein